ncbi:MAG: zinc ABC transporter substrate-binding protein [Candidatus Andersenbacteria bacterium]|nr:zinc ABC transporter substrate-binding protein [Candidatus Andersenbacteria bacterium]
MNVSKVVIAIVFVLTLLALVHWGWKRQHAQPIEEGVQVVASFYPWAEFARQAGGSLVHVTTVVPADSEPHEYEPTPQQLAQAYNAAVFIYNGSGFDPWAERIAPELAQKGVRVINMSKATSLLAAPAPGGEAEVSFDLHFWLNPVLVQTHVGVIRDALVAVDAAHASAYKAQADTYKKQLAALDQEYKAGLASCERRDIVTSHAAFGYLAKQYGLSLITVSGISTEEEPSARAVSEIAKTAKEKNIQYIFFETLVSPKLAQTVASEIGAKTLVFNPLEGLTGQEQRAGANYISVMRENLQNLRTALKCT